MDSTATDPIVGCLLDGRYRVRRQLARGGMATVYEGEDTRLQRQIAVKVMHPAFTEDAEFVRRFHREAQSAAVLSHPNLVAVFDQGHDADTGADYLTMEYVPGSTLRDLLADHGPLDPASALEVLEPVLDALAAAHHAGMIHRDVKPENILLGANGEIKVADFGLARAITAATATSSKLIGTVSYLAPEQLVGERTDARSDVYAAGVVLYETLTGSKPHRGENPIQVAYKHVNEDVGPPSARVGGLPRFVDGLVLRSTARDPHVRPADARVLGHHVRRARAALRQGVDDPELAQDLLAFRVTAPPDAASGTERADDGDDGDDGSGEPDSAADSPAVSVAPAATPTRRGPAKRPAAGRDPAPKGKPTAKGKSPAKGKPTGKGKAPAKKAPAKKAPAKKATGKKTPPGRSPTGKNPTRKVPAGRNPTRKVPGEPGPGASTGRSSPGDGASRRGGGGPEPTTVGPLASAPASRKRGTRTLGTREGSESRRPAPQGRPSGSSTRARSGGRPRTEGTRNDRPRNDGPRNDGPRNARTGSPRPRGRPLSRRVLRRRRLVASLLLLVLVLGAGFGYWYAVARYTEVPDLTEISEGQLKARVRASDLRVDVADRRVWHDEIAPGHVVSVSPSPGERVLRGETLRVVLSRGVERHELPDLVGKPLEQARAALEKRNLDLAPLRRVYRDDAPTGEVVGITPEPGKVLVKDSSVRLTVSRGPAPVDVPSVTGQTLASARTTLREIGLEVRHRAEFSDSVPEGQVASQRPEPGEAHRGDTVRLVVSKGPEFRTLPDVTNTSVEEAERRLTELGFEVNITETDLHIGANLVVGQSPTSGEKLRQGETVTLETV